ncbi:MAG TPA: tetratricopeptide repeat protein, partial [Longimicrobiales bacterium]|nr:tetratricopeptide repeat protein [Longimicrobiales bacterium]
MSSNGSGDQVEGVLREALELGEDGRWDEMARLLNESIEEENADPVLLCWLGVAESELGNDGAAYDAFRRCVDQDPTDPHVLALAGAGLAEFDDPDAEVALRAAALSAPDLPMARLNYGAFLARAGLFAEALEQLNAARELTPDDPVVRAELGAAHVLAGEPEE